MDAATAALDGGRSFFRVGSQKSKKLVMHLIQGKIVKMQKIIIQ
jgi:hypothetical protein